MLVLASHQARERLLSKCNEQGIAGLSDFMKEGRLLCCKSESLSCCWFAFMSCCVAGFAFFGSSVESRAGYTRVYEETRWWQPPHA